MPRVEVEVGAKNTVRPALAEMRKDFRSFSAEIERDIARASVPGRARDSASVFTGVAAARSRQWGEQVSASFNRPAGRGPLADGSAFAAAAAADAEAAAALGKNEAERGAAAAQLAAARRNDAMAEATTIGRMKILQGELVALARQRAAVEKGSTAELKLQLQIQERYAQFRALGRTAQAERIRIDTSDLPKAEKQVGGFFSKLKNKFSAGGIGMSILGGIGLGSGFALAQSAAEMIAGFWQRAAESAKHIADESERTTAAVLRRLRINETDDQKNTRESGEASKKRARAKELIQGKTVEYEALDGTKQSATIAPTDEDFKQAATLAREAAELEADVADRKKKQAAELAAERQQAYEKQQAAEEKYAALIIENAQAQLALEEKLVTLRNQRAALLANGELPSLIKAEEIQKEILGLEKEKQTAEERAARDLASAQEKLRESEDKIAAKIMTPGERTTDLQRQLAEARTDTGIASAAGNTQGAAEAKVRENELALQLASALEDGIKKSIPEVGSNGAIGLNSAGVNTAMNPEANKMVDLLKDIYQELRDQTDAASRNSTPTVQSTASRGYSP